MAARNPNMKTISYAMPTANITKLAKDLKANGYDVEKTSDTLVASADGIEYVRAMKMRGNWALRADPAVITAV